jgi:hypothetical protein
MGVGCLPQSVEGVQVHEVVATAPVHGEPSHHDQWVDYEGKPSWLGDTIRVIYLVKGDWGFRLVKVLWGSQAHNVNCPTCECVLTSGLVGGKPAIDQHDYLFIRKGGNNLP